MSIKKYAAIDIGSNAMRLLIMLIVNADGKPIFIKDTYLRLPVRLGGDAFDKGNRVSIVFEISTIIFAVEEL